MRLLLPLVFATQTHGVRTLIIPVSVRRHSSGTLPASVRRHASRRCRPLTSITPVYLSVQSSLQLRLNLVMRREPATFDPYARATCLRILLAIISQAKDHCIPASVITVLVTKLENLVVGG